MSASAQSQAHRSVAEVPRQLSWVAILLFIGAGITYLLRGPIIALVQRPLGHAIFYGTPTANFAFALKVSFLAGFLVALPALVIALVCHLQPAFVRHVSRATLAKLIAASVVLVALGVSFGFQVCLPLALHFYSDVADGGVQPLITSDQYFGFIASYIGLFAVMFQTPLVGIYFYFSKFLQPGLLQKFRRYVAVGSFGVALIAPAPPGLVSLLMIALPMIALYEATIWLTILVHRRQQGAFEKPAAAPAVVAKPAPPAKIAHQTRPIPTPPTPALATVQRPHALSQVTPPPNAVTGATPPRPRPAKLASAARHDALPSGRPPQATTARLPSPPKPQIKPKPSPSPKLAPVPPAPPAAPIDLRTVYVAPPNASLERSGHIVDLRE